MTDREALDKAQNELDTSSYLAELSLNIGLRKVHQNRIAWLARVLRLARKALYIEENKKQPMSNEDRIQEMEAQAPQPLSIDELRQMIGLPVWVTHRDGSGGRWGIVNEYSGSLCADVASGRAYWFDDYIGTVAYRHRPLTQEAAP